MPSSCVVITGASAGIGRATALEFANRGYRVALLARGIEGLDAARREVEELGTTALAIQVDVADHEQVEAAAERIEQELGPIEVWVNNAMATIHCPAEKITPQDFERATHVTYLGSVWGTLAALRRMKARNRGTIVQVGSALAYRAIPLQAPYCAAKSALRGFTDSLRSELIHDKTHVHLTMVHLCAFNTPQFDWSKTCMEKQPQPVPPIYAPELAARAIAWAAEHRRRELWVGFPTFKAIIGTRLFPGLLDRHLARKAYSAQQADVPVSADRQENLYRPVPGDHGMRGRFTMREKTSSWHFWLNTHRWTAMGVAVTLAAAGLALGSSRIRTKATQRLR